MKKKTYFENLNSAIINNNKKSFKYRDGKAWDNKKKKTAKSHMPRGKMYRRFMDMQWRGVCSQLTDDMNGLLQHLSELQ